MATNPHKRVLYVYEVFERANNLSPEQQYELFKENSYPAVMQMAQLAFGNFEYLIPTDSVMPYTASSEESHPANLHKEYKKIPYIVKGTGNDNVAPIKRESILRSVLESVHPSDAELINTVVQGRFKEKYPNVDQAALARAFPAAVKAPVAEAASLSLVNTDDDLAAIQILESDLTQSGYIFTGKVDGPWDFSGMEQESFNELRRAVMRENHARKKS